MNWNKRK